MYKIFTQQRVPMKKQAGFTIVELMIATMVFSVILVTITVGVMYFTHSYYKGVYAGMTQNAARDISDAVTQAVQFGTGEPTAISTTTHSYFCAGGYVFVYKVGEQYIASDTTATGMYMQPMTGNCDDSVTSPSPAASAQRRQLLGDRMRVTYLSLTGAGGLYTLDIKVAYGDTDLLSDPTRGIGADIQCNIGTGSEYCAIARYTTSVSQRKT